MSHRWAYVAAVVVLVAIGGVAASYYFGYGQPSIRSTPVTVHVSGMTIEGAVPITGVHVTASYGGQSFTAVTNIYGQALFSLPINTHVTLTDDLSGYKTIDTVDSSMIVPLFH